MRTLALATVLLSASGFGQTVRHKPRMSNGYAVDQCLTWGTNCGKPAADRYCRMIGFAGGAAGFQTAAMRPTWILGDNRVCNESYCVGFTSVDCVRGGENTGTVPKLSNGYAVDACLHWGRECGKPAADQYCRMSGFADGAASFQTAQMRPTWVLGDGRACNDTYCTGFTSIQCARAGTPPPSATPPSAPPPPSTRRRGAWTYRDMVVYSAGDRPELRAKTISEKVGLQGGTVEVNVVGDNFGVCPGGVERLRFQWRIDKDISQVMPGDSFGWTGTAQMITKSNQCSGGLAYRTWFRLGGSMGATIPLPSDFPRWDGDRFMTEGGGARAHGALDDPNRNAANGSIKVNSIGAYPDRQIAFFFVVFEVPGEARFYVFRYDAPK